MNWKKIVVAVVLLAAIAIIVSVVFPRGIVGEPQTMEEKYMDDPRLTAPAAVAPLYPTERNSPAFRVFELRLSRDGVDPSRLVVKKGDGVQFNLIAEDGVYDFNFPAFGVYVVAAQGKTEVVGFEASKAGVFKFSCAKQCPPGGPGVQGGEFEVLAE